jgi:phosphoglycerate dehydrogenase-like enzyme
MEVIAWSQNLTPERAREGGAEYVDKEALFSRADVVSVHLVLGERTRGIVGAPELARMKPGAILVNTSRGPLIDEAALLAALDAGRIRAAGLDVFEVEPLPEDHPLRRAPNLVTTPHLGYVTEGTYQAFFEDMVEDIAAWRAGTPVRILDPA